MLWLQASGGKKDFIFIFSQRAMDLRGFWYLHSSEVNVDKWSLSPNLNSNLSFWSIFTCRVIFSEAGPLVTSGEYKWHVSEPWILSIIFFTRKSWINTWTKSINLPCLGVSAKFGLIQPCAQWFRSACGWCLGWSKRACTSSCAHMCG